jgi:sarcosine oxidase subunit alpha
VTDRLAAPAGLLIDRNKPVAFSFEGRDFTGFEGDTIASALTANSIRALSRSFKFHRPRGVLTMAGQDGNTLVHAGDSPDVLADRVRITPGLQVRALNTLGGLDRDLLGGLDRLARFLPAGFYYKAFFRPRPAWALWEPVLRRIAGLGRVGAPVSDTGCDKQYLHADVAVIGGGPAGLAAAAQAARAGAEVVLVDENPVLGGALTYRREASSDKAARAVEAADNVTVMTDTLCNGWFSDNWLALIRDRRMYKLRAKAVVVATGAIEQPAIFRNNDLPGIMLGGAAQRLIRHYGVRPGRRAVVLTANSEGYGVALDLGEAGVEVACVVDLREPAPDHEWAEAVHRRGIPVLAQAAVWAAESDRNRMRGVRAARVARITGRGTCGADVDRFACDLITMSCGYMPAAALACQAGARMVHDTEQPIYRVENLPDRMFLAGAVAGVYGSEAVVEDGRVAGHAAAADAGFRRRGRKPARRHEPESTGLCHPWPMFRHPKGKEFVDFDEDLQIKDIVGAVGEGYDHVELVKRFSTATMGPSQGRLSTLATVRIIAEATGADVAAVGVTTSRPPVIAESFAHLAGQRFEPVRLTPMHDRHRQAGAKMMVAGAWMRPAYYESETYESETQISAEARNVRDTVGLIDVSTLGGLEVRGPDAAEFLERMYTFAYAKQPVGRARYVLMCDRTGVIVDDGVACRLAEDWFYVTATSGGVDGVYRQMLWHNAQWRLGVDVTNVTAAYAGINIAGPKAREVLAPVCEDVDLAAAAFPYMGVREGRVGGFPARLLRVGFVGELGYEIHVPAPCGEALWDRLVEAGRGQGLRPFGVEAQRLLRLEKGHIIVGQDTDGLSHPIEADMAWAISRKKPYFVGGRAIAIRETKGLSRKLVGFEITDPAAPVPEECHLILRDSEITGRVTSVARSPVLGKVIGLAYVAPDQAEPGSVITIKVADGRRVPARVVEPPFYDPDGARQDM